MVVRQSIPFDFVAPRRRMSRTTGLVVAGSVGLHALVAAYLAMMQFAPPKAPRRSKIRRSSSTSCPGRSSRPRRRRFRSSASSHPAPR